MKKENSGLMINRIFKRALFITLIIILTIFIFTKSPLYCIMFLVGSGISFLGYYIMIRVVDRVISKKKGKGLFILAGLGKMTLISVIFIFISRYSEAAVLFYLLGLSVIIFSIIGEGGRQLLRSFKDGT
ncbi:MAG: ATP synthase subunit I [Acidobacteriota bacterium]